MMRGEVLRQINTEEVRGIYHQPLRTMLKFVNIWINAEVSNEYVSNENRVRRSNNRLRTHLCVVVKDHLCKFMLCHTAPNGGKWEASLFESGECRVNEKPIKAPPDFDIRIYINPPIGIEHIRSRDIRYKSVFLLLVRCSSNWEIFDRKVLFIPFDYFIFGAVFTVTV